MPNYGYSWINFVNYMLNTTSDNRALSYHYNGIKDWGYGYYSDNIDATAWWGYGSNGIFGYPAFGYRGPNVWAMSSYLNWYYYDNSGRGYVQAYGSISFPPNNFGLWRIYGAGNGGDQPY